MLTPDTKKSQDFLTRWGFPVTLVAIKPDGGQGATVAHTFTGKDGLEFWLTENNANRNIYFTVNNTPLVHKKPTRNDITSINALHVDIDPRAGEELKAERRKALGALRKPSNGTPPPTVIIDSGGGYQGFWRFTKPVPADDYDTLASYNKYLEQQFEADACHNIDRLMRLPGTINWPNQKKREQGREPKLAKLVMWDEGNVYAGLDSFHRAKVMPTATKVELDIDTSTRIESTADLPVSDKCKLVINQGTDPLEPDKYPSRSEAVWFVVCEMVRSGCDDSTIYSVLLDPNFKISSAGRQKGKKWVRLQIEKARGDGELSWIDRWNNDYAVIDNVGGKTLVLIDRDDEEPHFKSFENFKNMTSNDFIEFRNESDKMVKIPRSKMWLESPKRRNYRGIEFDPNGTRDDYYNEWRGFSVQPIPGDCSLYLDHVRRNIAGDRQDVFNYIIGWMAYAVQFPGRVGGTAIVMRGGRGTGKSIFANEFGRLFGPHYFSTGSAAQLTGRFNDHLRTKVVVFADEAFNPRNKSHEATLKTMITSDRIAYEAKGLGVTYARNFNHLIMASNDSQVVPAGPMERRFLVVDVEPNNQQDIDYFESLLAQMRNGGREALLHYLQTYDLSEYNLHAVPQTDALDDQKVGMVTSDPFLVWWFEQLQEGSICGMPWDARIEVYCKQLMDFATDWARKSGHPAPSSSSIGRQLKKLAPQHQKKRKGTDVMYFDPSGKEQAITKPNFYILPSLADCREAFKREMGMPSVKFEDLEIDSGDNF